MSLVSGYRNIVSWKNVILQVLHLGLGGLLLFGLWLAMGRGWGVGDFGAFNYLYTLAASFGIIIDFGLDILLTRLTSSGERGFPGQVIRIKIAVFIPAVILFLIIVMSTRPRDIGPFVILMSGVALLSTTTLLNGVLRGLERLDIEACIGLAQKVVFVAVALVGLMLLDARFYWVAGAYMFSHVMGCCATWRFMPDNCRRIYAHHESVMSHFKEVVQFWVINVLWFLTLRIDIFFLEWMSTDYSVGVFSAAFRFIEGFSCVGLAFMTALFPRLVKSREDNKSFYDIIKKSLIMVFILGFFVFIFCFIFAKHLIFLFGDEFSHSQNILIYLSSSIPFIFSYMVLGYSFIANKNQKYYLISLFLGIISSLAVSKVLIVKYDYYGAVFTFSGRSLITFFFLCASVKLSSYVKKKKMHCTS